MDAHNTFAAPDTVKPASFKDATIQGDKLVVKLPPLSIVVLELN